MSRRLAAAVNLLKAWLLLLGALPRFSAALGWWIGGYAASLFGSSRPAGGARASTGTRTGRCSGCVGARELRSAEARSSARPSSALRAGRGVVTPKLYVIADGFPRALVAGRGPRGSSIAVSTGLLGALRAGRARGRCRARARARPRAATSSSRRSWSCSPSTLRRVLAIGGWFQRALLYVLGPVAASFVASPALAEARVRRRPARRELCESPHGLADALLRLDQASELVSFTASPATGAALHRQPVRGGRPGGALRHPPAVGERVAGCVSSIRECDRTRDRGAHRVRRKGRIAGPFEKNRRRPTLPGGCPPSTIGAGGLNFSVRNGKRCTPAAMTTEIVKGGRRNAGAHLQNSIAISECSKSRPRAISTGPLNALLRLHVPPINVVVSHGPYSLEGMGSLISRWASRLDAFSGYPIQTWLISSAVGTTTDTPEVCSSRSSRTRDDSSQASSAHGG